MKQNHGVTSKVITIVSGKGGVGKTTTAVSFGVGLAMKNKKVVIIDFDIGLKKLDLLMGCEIKSNNYNIIDVLNEKIPVEKALITGLYKEKCGNNLALLPTSNEYDKTALKSAGIKNIIEKLKELKYDYIICDSPAGIENGTIQALNYADEVIIVVNPEIQSIRDGVNIISKIYKYSLKENQEKVIKHLLITKYNKKLVKQQISIDQKDIINIVEYDNLLGTITDSSYDTLTASNKGLPVILLPKPKSTIVDDYKEAIQVFLGKKIYKPEESGNFIIKLFGNLFGNK